jgi:hypothetical protein
MAQQWAYKLVMTRYEDTQHVDFFFGIDDWNSLITTRNNMCMAGWQKWYTYVFNQYWILTGSGNCVCPA